jgi:hypothetical protein
MFRFKVLIKVFLSLTIFWLILSVLFGRFNSSSDGYNEIGFPFTFYRSFSGKCFNCKVLGLLGKELLLDIVILIVITFIFQIVVKKIKTTH